MALVFQQQWPRKTLILPVKRKSLFPLSSHFLACGNASVGHVSMRISIVRKGSAPLWRRQQTTTITTQKNKQLKRRSQDSLINSYTWGPTGFVTSKTVLLKRRQAAPTTRAIKHFFFKNYTKEPCDVLLMHNHTTQVTLSDRCSRGRNW